MKAWAAGLAGLLLVGAMLASVQWGEMEARMLAVGWFGLLALTGYRLVPVLLCAQAWHVLSPGHRALSRIACLKARMVRDAVAMLGMILPAGGEIVGARVLALAGLSGAEAAAMTIADVTVEMISQTLFTLLGLMALALAFPSVVPSGLIAGGLLAILAMTLGLLAVQHPKMLAWLREVGAGLVRQGGWGRWFALDGLLAALQEQYRRPGALAASTAVHLLAWLAGIGETWLALRLMGQPLSLTAVLAIESLVFVARSLAFFVPWAAGVMEGGYLAVGSLFGLSPEIALTLSVLRRFADLFIGLPGLLFWQLGEHRQSRVGGQGE